MQMKMESPNNFFQLTLRTLSESEARADLHNLSCGAHVLFVGTVRNRSKGEGVTHLEFEAYEPMVHRVLTEIAADLRKEFGVTGVLLHHRIGRVEAGEPAVIAGISAPHRAEAFHACEALMNRLKQSVPIWKKEFTASGAVWVSPTP
jgi:molybdopterin synthase catalytic subunit